MKVLKKISEKDFLKGDYTELTERQLIILSLIETDSTITSGKKPVTVRTIENDIAKLKKMGILTREGGRKDGRWVITKK